MAAIRQPVTIANAVNIMFSRAWKKDLLRLRSLAQLRDSGPLRKEPGNLKSIDRQGLLLNVYLTID